jgi:hypothetical protein
MHRWIDRVIGSLHHRLAAETDRALWPRMPFLAKWAAFFTDRMSVADAYRHATPHFDFHRQQCTADHICTLGLFAAVLWGSATTTSKI